MSRIIDKLRDLEKNHQLLSEKLIDAIWIADLESLKFEYITASIQKLSGYSPEEYINLSFEQRVSAESFKDVKLLLERGIEGFNKKEKRIGTVEVELIHKSDGFYWGEIRARLVKDSDGRIKIVGLTRDITKRKKIELEKNEIIEELKNVIKEKEVLLKENKLLKGLLPICSACKRIRDQKGRWWPLDAYVEKASKVELTHTICLDCKEAFYGDEEWYKKQKKMER
jgi:PAS domain S-box-containing protein